MKTDLLSSALRDRTVTFFALGGSGARAVEPLLHLCAMGLGPLRLRIVIIDPDQANAAVTRARHLMDLYRTVRRLVAGGSAPAGYFRTELLDPVSDTLVWSPILDEQFLPSNKFAVRAGRTEMERGATVLGEAFDLLYADRLQEMDLGKGFRGVPAIGTVFMNRLRTEPFFRQILTQAQTEPTSVFFAVGTLFGGTGAAALPVVGRCLSGGLKHEPDQPELDGPDVRGVDRSRIGAALLLPYFTLPSPHAGERETVRPEAALFAQNAAAAVPTYLSNEPGYGAYYVLGDSEPREQPVNEVGGEQQANPAHYIELFAALAALDFSARPAPAGPVDRPGFRIAAVSGSTVTWDDLPVSESSLRRMMGAVVAAHTFLTVFRPGGALRPDLGRYLAGATWLHLVQMRGADLDAQAETLNRLGEYYEELWRWLAELRASTPGLHAGGSTAQPTTLRLDQAVALRPSAGTSEGPHIKDGFRVFRDWNHAAYRLRRPGLAGMLEVAREGSETAAERWFGAPRNGRSA